ncbi:MAG: hypothetical protein KatS3mg005_0812 [Bryobacteraceae bacterium]|nr:MAG: hypothetical protein KatS3mg005_0812 [Bryobacteraceae bacterium]
MSGFLPWPWRRRREEGSKAGPRLALLRLLARLFDYALFGLLLMLASMQSGRWAFTGFWLPVKLALLAAPWMALWTALLGATPGKMLLRLRVRSLEPGRVGLAAAMRREGRCLLSGVALGTPLAVFTMINAGLACTFHFGPVWDRRARTRVVLLPAAAGWPPVLHWLGAAIRLAVLAAVFRLFTLGLDPRPDALRAALETAAARAAALQAGWAALLP